MKALFIGGTGTISTSITRLLSAQGVELTLLNRGSHPVDLPHVRTLSCDIRNLDQARSVLADESFDVVCDFICFTPDHARADLELFQGRTKQFIFISSASAYRKPNPGLRVRESTPLLNPYWRYSRDKAECERLFLDAFEKDGFPITIVRPSHTFSDSGLPVPVHGNHGAWAVVRRMLQGKPIPVPGDGESVWAVLPSDEFARAFVGLMGNPAAVGEAIQITGEELLTWNQILRTEAAAFGGTYVPLYVPSVLLAACHTYDFYGALLGDKSNTVLFDNRKLHQLVPGYRQEEMFHHAIARTAARLKKEPELLCEDPEFDAFCDALERIMDTARTAVEAL